MNEWWMCESNRDYCKKGCKDVPQIERDILTLEQGSRNGELISRSLAWARICEAARLGAAVNETWLEGTENSTSKKPTIVSLRATGNNITVSTIDRPEGLEFDGAYVVDDFGSGINKAVIADGQAILVQVSDGTQVLIF
jgi:hypothetical protein